MSDRTKQIQGSATDKRPVAWVENHNEAEIRHGCERNSDLERLSPRSFEGRWRSNPNDLAEACWESGWDSAVIACKGYILKACGHLEVAIMQSIDKDDQIIMDHVRDALAILRGK